MEMGVGGDTVYHSMFRFQDIISNQADFLGAHFYWLEAQVDYFEYRISCFVFIIIKTRGPDIRGPGNSLFYFLHRRTWQDTWIQSGR